MHRGIAAASAQLHADHRRNADESRFSISFSRRPIVALEEVLWGDVKRTLTKAYMLFLARWARRLSWKETAESFRTCWDKVSTQSNMSSPGVWNTGRSARAAIGIDEIQYSKGHRYLTLVYQIELDVTRLL